MLVNLSSKLWFVEGRDAQVNRRNAERQKYYIRNNRLIYHNKNNHKISKRFSFNLDLSKGLFVGERNAHVITEWPWGVDKNNDVKNASLLYQNKNNGLDELRQLFLTVSSPAGL